MGRAGEGQNITHQAEEDERGGAARLPRPLQRAAHRRGVARRRVLQAARRQPGDAYLRERRAALGGSLPRAPRRGAAAGGAAARGLRGAARRTPASARSRRRWPSCGSLATLVRDKELGPPRGADRGRRVAHVRHGGDVPPARHLLARWASSTSPRTPSSSCSTGRTRRARSSRRASTRPARSRRGSPRPPRTPTTASPMIPFYIFYSMFGFQRIGDLVWAAGDSRARGFLLGGTAGRTTLNGEGLQHEDGHSHVLASTVPNCRRLRPDVRLRGRGDPAGRPAPDVRRAGGRLLLPDGDERELRATRRCRRARRRASSAACTCSARATGDGPRVQLMGSGTILREVLAAADLLERATSASPPTSGASPASPSCAATASPPSAGTGCTRPRSRAPPYVEELLGGARGPGRRRDRLHAARSPTDPRRSCRGRYSVLGTDGFGRSDYRAHAAPLLRGRPPPRRASPRSTRWPTTATIERRDRRRGDRRATSIDPEAGPRRWQR